MNNATGPNARSAEPRCAFCGAPSATGSEIAAGTPACAACAGTIQVCARRIAIAKSLARRHGVPVHVAALLVAGVDT